MAKKKRKKRIPSFVLDSSMALAWCFPDEKASYPQSVMDSLASGIGVVPAIWRLEIANALLMGERRKRSTQENTASWTRYLATLPIMVDEQTQARAWSDILTLGRTHNLSAYDASYLELALRRKLPLATLDDKLKKTAGDLGLSLYEP